MDEVMDDDLYNQIFSKTDDNIGNFKKYEFDPADFLDRGAIWYGATKSGKTFHIKYCLNQMKHIFPRVILFSTTTESSGDFDGIVNKEMIFTEFTEEKFVEQIEAQMEIMDVYRRITKKETLEEVFAISASTEQKNMYKKILLTYENRINSIKRTDKSDNIKLGEINIITKKFDKMFINFLRTCIIPIRNKIDIEQLSETGRECVKYIDMNPRVLFIFDDVQNELNDMLSRRKSKGALTSKNLFSRGRHNMITHWYTLQDDTSLPAALRKNAKISVLTQVGIANGFIARATNGIDKESQKLGLELTRKIFTGEGHKKIIYFADRSGNEKFQYHTAEECGLFCVGSEIVNSYCNELVK